MGVYYRIKIEGIEGRERERERGREREREREKEIDWQTGISAGATRTVRRTGLRRPTRINACTALVCVAENSPFFDHKTTLTINQSKQKHNTTKTY
jgi:hypothetical protein